MVNSELVTPGFYTLPAALYAAHLRVIYRGFDPFPTYVEVVTDEKVVNLFNCRGHADLHFLYAIHPPPDPTGSGGVSVSGMASAGAQLVATDRGKRRLLGIDPQDLGSSHLLADLGDCLPDGAASAETVLATRPGAGWSGQTPPAHA